MPTLNLTITAGADDGRWNDGSVGGQNAYYSSSETGLPLGSVAAGFDFVSGWLRFTGLQFTGAPTITAATLTVTEPASSGDAGACTFTVWGVKQDGPTAPTTGPDAVSRPKTTASVGAFSPAVNNAGTTWSPADLSAIIQELANAYDYVTAPKALMLYLIPNATPTGQRTIASFESASGKATLSITYTAGGGTSPTSTDTAAVAESRSAAASVAATDSASLADTGLVGSPPGAPQTVAASFGYESVSATWTAPASNGGSAITGYVAILLSGGTAVAAKSTAGTSISFTASDGVQNGTAYTVSIAAKNAIGTGPSAASSAVVPSFLGALQLKLDASAIAGVADGAALAVWPDGSGKARDAVQSTGANQPAFRATGINGKPAVDFASGKTMATPAFLDASYNTSFSLYVVFKRATGAGTQTPYSLGADQHHFDISGAVPLTNQNLKSGSSPTIASNPPAGLAAVPTPNTVSLADLVVASITYDGTYWLVSANGIENQLMAAGAAANVATSGNLALTGAATLGALAGGTQAFGGLLAYLAIYNVAHSRTDRQAEELRLRLLYGAQPDDLVEALGDSVTYGQASSSPTTTSWPGQMLPILTSKRAHLMNVGIGGTTALDWIDGYVNQAVLPNYLPDRKRNILLVMVSGNDGDAALTSPLGQESTGSERHNRIRAICQAAKRQGWLVVVGTLAQRGAGNASFDVANNLIRANWQTYADALLDPTSLPAFDAIATGSPRAGGTDATVRTHDLTNYANDGSFTHWSDAGNLLVAQLAQPLVDALPAAPGVSVRRQGLNGGISG